MTEKVKEYRILFNDEDTLTLDPSDLITSHFLEVNKTITNYTAKGETFKEDFICAEKALEEQQNCPVSVSYVEL